MLTQNPESPVLFPPVDIFETEHEVVLEAEMAGVPKEGAQLAIEGDELTITGNTAESDLPKEYTPLYAERRPRQYRRVFVLGAEVQKDKIRAHYENGLLRINLPKAEKPQPKKIAIE
jgi:HSP20 family protein